MIQESLILLLTVFLQVSPEMESALEALEKNETPEVTQALGREAVRLLEDTDDPQRLEWLITIALKGRAEFPLGGALVRVIAKSSGRPELSGAAVKSLSRLNPQQRLKHLRSPPKGWNEKLERLVRSEEDDVAKASAIVIAPTVSADLIRRLLRTWVDEEREQVAVGLLSQAAHFSRPLQVFRVLARVELEGDPAQEALARAVAVLVRRDDAVADEALREARIGDSSAVMRSLGALSLRKHVLEASRILESRVDPEDLEDERFLAAGLRSAGDLLVAELKGTAEDLALLGDAPETIRRAAIWAFARLAYKDANTIDMLIQLLKDPAVAGAAHQALVYKTGVRLRGELGTWQTWRRTASLPADPPDDASERLEKARELRFRIATMMRKRARKKRKPTASGDPPEKVPTPTVLRRATAAEEAPEYLARLGHKRPAVRNRAARNLVRLAKRDAMFKTKLRRILTEILAETRKLTGVRRAGPALSALIQLDGLQALPEVLVCVESPRVRRAGLEQLGRVPKPANWEARLDSPLRRGPEASLIRVIDRKEQLSEPEQRALLRALRRWGTHEAVPALLELLKKSPELEPRVFLTLTSLTRVEHPDVAAWSAWWGKVGPIWKRYPQLLRQLSAAPSGAEAPAILDQIGRIRDERTIEAVEGVFGAAKAEMTDRELTVCERGCEILARYADKVAARPLIALLKIKVPARLQSKAVWALSTLAGRPVTKDQTDPEHWRREFFPKPGERRTATMATGTVKTTPGPAVKTKPSSATPSQPSETARDTQPLEDTGARRKSVFAAGFAALIALFGGMLWLAARSQPAAPKLVTLGEAPPQKRRAGGTNQWSKGLEGRTAAMSLKLLEAFEDEPKKVEAEAAGGSEAEVPAASQWTQKLKVLAQGGGGLQIHGPSDGDDDADDRDSVIDVPPAQPWTGEGGTARFNLLKDDWGRPTA